MRFQTIPAFEKHLVQSFKEGRPFLFTLLAPDPLERKWLREKILMTIRKSQLSFEVVEKDLTETSLQFLRQELDSSDLFVSLRVFVLKNLDKASKAIIEGISDYLLQGGAPCVIFEGQDAKAEGKLYEKLKKEMVVIDLSKEKPWERKTRLLSWVDTAVQKNKKTIHKEALELLYDKCQKQFSVMMQEIEKLLCYAKDLSEITPSHLNALCGLEAEVNTWALCEEVVWENGLSLALSKELDAQDFYPLLGQLRYQCQIGLKISKFLMNKDSHQEMQEAFPQIQPKNLSKYLRALEGFDSNYFTNALSLLFDYEMKGKSQNMDQSALWMSLILHLKQLQKKS